MKGKNKRVYLFSFTRFGLLFNSQEVRKSTYARKSVFTAGYHSFLITRKCGSQLMLVKVFYGRMSQCSFINSCYCMHPVLLQAFFLQSKLSLTGLICIQKVVRLLIEVTKCRIINSRGVTEGQFATA